MKKQVAIVHFNTPELTEAAIRSIRKHGGKDYEITVLDNSQDVDYPESEHIKGMKMKARPFTKKMNGVRVIDNTKGQVVDIDAELSKYNQNLAWYRTYNNWGSVRHMISIQALWDILPDGFLLMDSDVLLKKSVDFMFQPDQCCVGYIQNQPGNPFHTPRLMPTLCYINPKLCREGGVNYYDPTRCWMLNGNREDKRNWYDTGASFLEDIIKNKPKTRGVKLSRDYYAALFEHFGSGSWKDNSRRDGGLSDMEWLMQHKDLWMPEHTERPKSDKIAVCAIGRLENRYAKEFVDHYLKLGFDKVIIYDNNYKDEEHFDTVLKTYITKGQVDIIDWRGLGHQQNTAYRDAYCRYGEQYQWIVYFDFDELLQVEGGRTIKDVLADRTADVVTVNWENYGDGGQVKATKKNMATRFTVPCDPDIIVKDPTHPDNYHVKSFVRGGLPFIFWRNPHCPVIIGKYETIEGQPSKLGPFHKPDYSVARLRHYVTKTIEEWMTLKVVRGEGCSRKNTETLRANPVGIFFQYNERTPEKEEWLKANGFSE